MRSHLYSKRQLYFIFLNVADAPNGSGIRVGVILNKSKMGLGMVFSGMAQELYSFYVRD